MTTDLDGLLLGKKYKVSIEDCCVDLYFTATVVSLERDAEEPHCTLAAQFDNGVRITSALQHWFEEVS